MRYATSLVWALAFFLAIEGLTISPRQLAETSTQSTQSAVSSFSQVTQTYSSISTYFAQTRESIQSAVTVDQCSSILTQLTDQINQAVQVISGGCNCDTSGVDTNALQESISIWFIELQSITQIIQNRFPSYQNRFTSTFTQISTHVQLALGVAYGAGVNINHIVQNAVSRSSIDTNLLSRYSINTNQFTHVSEAVVQRTGAFANHPPPYGIRFPTGSLGTGNRFRYGYPHHPHLFNPPNTLHTPGYNPYPSRTSSYNPVPPHTPGYNPYPPHLANQFAPHPANQITSNPLYSPPSLNQLNVADRIHHIGDSWGDHGHPGTSHPGHVQR